MKKEGGSEVGRVHIVVSGLEVMVKSKEAGFKLTGVGNP